MKHYENRSLTFSGSLNLCYFPPYPSHPCLNRYSVKLVRNLKVKIRIEYNNYYSYFSFSYALWEGVVTFEEMTYLPVDSTGVVTTVEPWMLGCSNNNIRIADNKEDLCYQFSGLWKIV